MLTVPALQISWNFNIFIQNSPNFIKLAGYNGIIIRNMHVKFEPIQRSQIFSQKNAESAGPRNIIKFQHFFKVHQISSNLQNILESSSETCMWNLSQFREVNLFHRKMPTVPALEISWNFNIFSKFTKFHQTCRINWNHHQKLACEIWANSEKLLYLIEKCRQCRPKKFHEISIFFQSPPNLIKLAGYNGIIIRNMHVKFESIHRSLLNS